MREYGRYAIGILFLIGAIVLIVVGFNLIRNLFKNDTARQQEETAKVVNLLDAGRSGKDVRYTINGSVVGEEDRRSIRFTVDSNSRRVEVIEGYNNQVLKEQELPNTLQAYEAFTAALNGAGFTSAVDGKGRGDEAQSCPLGRRFSYEVAPGTRDAFRTWSTSCSRKTGTFTGNSSMIQTLFQQQIPDYTDFALGVKLTP